MLFGDGWDDESRVESDQRVSQRRELAVSPSHFEIAGADGVGDVAAAALGVLARMHYLNVQIRVLVQNLLNATVIAALLGLYFGPLRSVVAVLVVVVVIVAALVVTKRLVMVRVLGVV